MCARRPNRGTIDILIKNQLIVFKMSWKRLDAADNGVLFFYVVCSIQYGNKINKPKSSLLLRLLISFGIQDPDTDGGLICCGCLRVDIKIGDARNSARVYSIFFLFSKWNSRLGNLINWVILLFIWVFTRLMNGFCWFCQIECFALDIVKLNLSDRLEFRNVNTRWKRSDEKSVSSRRFIRH